MKNMTEDDYYVLLIIISIIGFTLLIAFAIYFLYLPAIRANDYFNQIFETGEDALDKAVDIAKQISITNVQTQAFIIGFCGFNDLLTPAEKNTLWGTSFDEFCDNLDIELPDSCC